MIITFALAWSVLCIGYMLALAFGWQGIRIHLPSRRKMPAWLADSERGYVDVARNYPGLGINSARDQSYDRYRHAFITATTDALAADALAAMLADVRLGRELWPPYSRADCRAVARGDGNNHPR